MPISGLSLETEAGFVYSTARNSTGPNVTGFSYANFNERLPFSASSGASAMWHNAIEPRVPGLGAIYTRSDAKEPMTPGSLPRDDGVSGIFLTAQTQNPIHGTAWGLTLEYNCSVVEKLSDLTILKRENLTAYERRPTFAAGMSPVLGGSFETGNRTVNMSNDTAWLGNLRGVTEFGWMRWPLDASHPGDLARGCYYDPEEHQNLTHESYHKGDQGSVFEIVLWQHLAELESFNPKPRYNTSLRHNLTELYGMYHLANPVEGSFSFIQGEPGQADSLPIPMSAIGVHCSSSAAVGEAWIDGARSTFTDFVPTDTPFNNFSCAARFNGYGITHVLQSTLLGYGWVNAIFSSISGEPQLYDKNLDKSINLSYLQPEQLRRSMLRIYAAYAINLMYGNGRGFISTSEGGGGVITGSGNPNVTAFPSGTVIKPGVVPMEVLIFVFSVWTLMTVVLCCVYGFRPRWSDTVDEGIRSFTR